MPGSFSIRKGRNGKFYFNLKGPNSEIILASQGYRSRAGCRKGIRSVRANAIDVERFERKRASNGRLYFVLKARNGQIIGTSQMYKSNRTLTKGLTSVRRHAAGARLVDH